MAKKIPISGVIGWDVSARTVRDALDEANGGDVEFVITSPGGFISTGLEIFNMIRDYPGKTTAVLNGFAMSMASYIPLACDCIKAADNAVFMIHNARGGVWGDHNEILGYGAFTKGLSGLLAKQYTKRTGKSLKEITDMMDKETFFFGDEIMAHGFCDEIMQTEDEKDSETALASAQAIYKEAYAKWTADTPAARSDMQQAMALLGDAPRAAATPSSPPAVAAGNKAQEVRQMTLAELLAANPAAQAEFNTAVQAARTEGVTAGTQTVEARIAAASPFLNNAAYGAAVSTLAVRVIEGKEAQGTLTAVITVMDAQREQTATTTAATTTTAAGETPAQQPTPPADPNAVISDDAGLEALKAQMKGGN